jgi:hypothetical protein
MQINSVTPMSAPPLAPVHINGSGFTMLTGATITVTVGGVQSSPVSVLSDTDLDFCVPQNAVNGNVVVSDGTNSATANGFTVVGAAGQDSTFEPILDDTGNDAQED